ncbi:MAG: DUF4466 family protein [Hymenobacteraceae bacterium]|nr:DUF4466 family protein [Hymenobacteraceae bacterium]MDX5394622.1 DUF4466 family protein [Hymenobacteraceae bacterium]MDX5443427.1 DUF4466 family protein [Hymenobacteraceae bacterium]MDX5510653.1 DUF4466 family protein [Hymenobacteraceae bacterium]
MLNNFTKLRTHFLAVLALASFTFLTSCGDDNDNPTPAPKATITFDPSAEEAELAPGQSVNLKVVVTSQDKLKEFKMSRSVAGVSNDTTVTSFPAAGYEFPVQYTVPANTAVGTQINFTFTATTKENQVTTRNYKVTVVGPVANYTAKIMGNQNASAGSFFSTADGSVLTKALAEATPGKVDFVFYHSSNASGDPQAALNQATIASPADAKAQQIHTTIGSWSKKNGTMFKFVGNNGALYDAMTEPQHLEGVYNNLPSQPTTAVTQLKQGEIFAFKTVDNRYGLARVKSVTTGTSGTSFTSEISLDVKVQR